MKGIRRTCEATMIAALENASTLVAAAEEAGCSPALIYVRARENPKIREAVEALKARKDPGHGGSTIRRRRKNARATAKDLSPEVAHSLAVLKSIADDTEATPSARVSAAKALLKYGEEKLVRYGEAMRREVETKPDPKPKKKEPEEDEKPLTPEQVAAFLRGA